LQAAPATWSALCAFAFLLGLRHGLDADHLATIDGLTRHNAAEQRSLARVCGALFSLGHGAVVLAVAAGLSMVAQSVDAPHWLEVSGAAVSITFLFALAYMNATALLRTAPGTVVATTGLKARLLGRFSTLRSGWAIAGVGALFAISFDTISQAALFAMAASQHGGVVQALLIASLFVAGMFAVDGLNGWWISGVIRRADRRAVIASRIMAITVAALSAAVGCLALVKVLLPEVAVRTEAYDLWYGAAVIGAVLVASLVGILVARSRGTSAPVAAATPSERAA